MNKLILLIGASLLTACTSLSSMYLPQPVAQSDAEIQQRRMEIQAMDNQDYQTERRRRKDAIQDLGEMQMNTGKAINKAYENRSRQRVYIVR